GFTASSGETNTTGQRVKAGDTVIYRISAWNPNPEEPLEFIIAGFISAVQTDWTTSETISITFEPKHIQRSVYITLQLRSRRTRELRMDSGDDSVSFVYMGIP